MMLVYQALRAAAGMLAQSGVPDPAVDAALLLSHVTGKEPLRLRAEGWEELSEADNAAYQALLARRAQREPLQYMLGEAPFMGLMLEVTPDVLIPRADTEVLCEAALSDIRPGMRVLDVCTGSGAIAIAIARLCPGAQVWASDVSEAALKIAKRNAQKHGAAVEFALGDLFAPFAGQKFDVILSNPPYIDAQDMGTLQAEVRREPELALYGGADGLDFYRRLAADAPQHLTPGGRIFFEIGCTQGAAVCALLARDFIDVEVLRDLRGLERVVRGTRGYDSFF